MIGFILTGIVLFTGSVLFSSILWINSFSKGLGMEQIIFHIVAPMAGADPRSVISGLLGIALPTLLISALFWGTIIYLNRQQIKTNRPAAPVLRRTRLLGLITGAGLIVASPFLANHYFDLFAFVSDQLDESDFIETHFVASADRLTFPDVKRNLIYINLESIENTFASIEEGGAFPQSYISELVELANAHISFSHTDKLGGAIPVSGATWTTGSMFAQSAGLPLKLPLARPSADGDTDLWPGVVALGDLLLEQGYQNHLMIGSDATFGFRRHFFSQHGQYEIFDYVKAKAEGKIPEDYFVWWGFEDQKLFGFAREKLLEISQSNQPFNLTLLTVDTHHENGFICELCDDEFYEQYANVLACSARQVKSFVEWLQKQDFYEQTTIIITGDHLTMDIDFTAGIDSEYVRTTYNVLINPHPSVGEPRTTNRLFTAFDLLPTTLASLGVEIRGDRLGLGTNLFSHRETLLEKFGSKFLEEISKRSTFYEEEFTSGSASSPS